MRKEIEQAKAEMERCDEDMDESEMEQFKFLFDMLNILSAMSSEEGADSFEAFKRCLGIERDRLRTYMQQRATKSNKERICSIQTAVQNISLMHCRKEVI